MPFAYRDDIACADVVFNAWAGTLEELFQEAARATMQAMVENLDEARPAETVELSLQQSDAEMLLFDFLNELIFYKDASRLILLSDLPDLYLSDQGCTMRVTLRGETIEATRHRLNTDVKAVTMLRFGLSRTLKGWQATVVLDV